MAAILGLRDTLSTDADRFGNWRRTVLVTFPNGGAPLTALLSLTESEPTDSPDFHWYEFPLPTQTSTVNGSIADDATTLVVDDAVFRAGHIVRNIDTGEIFKVTAVAGDGVTLTILRGKAMTAADALIAAVAMTDGDDLLIIGNSAAEGASLGSLLSYDPTSYSNYTQIFRTAWGVTGSAMGTPVKYDKTGKYARDARNALNLHSIEMEKAFLWGAKAQFTDPNTGKVERWTAGLYSWMSINAPANILDMSGAAPTGYTWTANTLTYPLWEQMLEQVFRVCLDNTTRQKLVLCGSGFASNLSQICAGKGTIQLMSGDKTFGLDIKRYEHPNGEVLIHTHPLFTQSATYRHAALILDFKGLVYRPKSNRDTRKYTNRQNPGDDQRVDEFLTECGLEMHHAPAHMVILGASKIA